MWPRNSQILIMIRIRYKFSSSQEAGKEFRENPENISDTQDIDKMYYASVAGYSTWRSIIFPELGQFFEQVTIRLSQLLPNTGFI